MMKILISKLKKCSKIAIFGHISVDADCTGSILAMQHFCNKYKIENKVFLDVKFTSKKLSFLNLKYSNADCDFDSFDAVVSVDVASKKQLGKYGEGFEKHKNSFCIDHHKSRDLKFETGYIDYKSAACCMIMYDFLQKAKSKVEPDIATALYAGVADDTGCFKHDNVSYNAHLIAAKLIEDGADYKYANYNLFKTITKSQDDLRKRLDQKAVFLNDIAYCVISLKDLRESKFTAEDTLEYVQHLIEIENVKVAFTLKQCNNKTYKMSIRCLQGFDINSVAVKFGGGGHKQASGAIIITNDLNTKIEEILSLIHKQLK